jgi:hypothetical protein
MHLLNLRINPSFITGPELGQIRDWFRLSIAQLIKVATDHLEVTVDFTNPHDIPVRPVIATIWTNSGNENWRKRNSQEIVKNIAEEVRDAEILHAKFSSPGFDASCIRIFIVDSAFALIPNQQT